MPNTEFFTAMDLGSNSFHMIVARVDDGKLTIIDRLRESIRLSGEIDEQHNISEAGFERAMSFLALASQRIKSIPAEHVRIVGTNVLRHAVNAGDFLAQAQQILGHRIEIISGVEEARLTYLGVAHNLADEGRERLVIDIGGSSTELIIGQRMIARSLVSLSMGSVSWTKFYFPKGKLTRENFKKAYLAAEYELLPAIEKFMFDPDRRVIGSSGTIRAIYKLIRSIDKQADTIKLSHLDLLIDQFCDAGEISSLKFSELKSERIQVLPGGLAVLKTVFEKLSLQSIEVSRYAIREGVLYDLMGRVHHHDVRSESVAQLMRRYSVDEKHASRVVSMANMIMDDVSKGWAFSDEERSCVVWACQLHEIGFAISHNSYHKHGEYILRHTDIPGFSMYEQEVLALLVRMHRKKPIFSQLESFTQGSMQQMTKMLAVLRLAIVLNRSRTAIKTKTLSFSSKGAKSIELSAAAKWFELNPLTHADLEQESNYLTNCDIKLTSTILDDEKV